MLQRQHGRFRRRRSAACGESRRGRKRRGSRQSESGLEKEERELQNSSGKKEQEARLSQFKSLCRETQEKEERSVQKEQEARLNQYLETGIVRNMSDRLAKSGGAYGPVKRTSLPWLCPNTENP